MKQYTGTLRYRVLVSAGDHKEAGVAERFAVYADGATNP